MEPAEALHQHSPESDPLRGPPVRGLCLRFGLSSILCEGDPVGSPAPLEDKCRAAFSIFAVLSFLLHSEASFLRILTASRALDKKRSDFLKLVETRADGGRH